MTENTAEDKTLIELTEKYPIIKDMSERKEVFWANPKYSDFETAAKSISLKMDDIKDAEERLARFAPYIAEVFPETKESNGIIESPLTQVTNFKRYLSEQGKKDIPGKLFVKCDSHLAISGSVKARGGIYEVLKHAESLALVNDMLSIEDDYSIIAEDNFRNFFSQYSIAVGSTGNLGLSIGIMSAKLGFKVFVHMSADAKQWKKDMLRSKGVNVIEYQSDYSKAVEKEREQAEKDDKMHFVDDENSTDLFLGYSVAALRLKKQFADNGIEINSDNPLFVYLPCGVGGGPGGITFGLKNVFGDNSHCFFAEPTDSPCMLLGLLSGMHDQISVRDIGLDNITDADGLAVATPSGFVGKTLENLISGCYTVTDKNLYRMLKEMSDLENINLEPSALAGAPGAMKLFSTENGMSYINKIGLSGKMQNATHIIWATGGSMVPEESRLEYYQKGSY